MGLLKGKIGLNGEKMERRDLLGKGV